VTESQATSKLIKKLNEQGYFWKASDKFRAGIPDIIGVHNGRFYSIEMKIDYNTPTPLQVYTMLQVVKNGGYAGVVTYSNKRQTWWLMGNSYTISELADHILSNKGHDLENSAV